MSFAKIRVALIALIPLLGFPLLPPEVASHFGPSGVADDFMPRGTFVILFICASALLVYGISWIARFIPSSADNRIAIGIKLYGLAFGIWMLLFFVILIHANRLDQPVISTTLIGLTSPVLFLPLIAFLLPARKARARTVDET
jgi:uncharacterized membrane protein